jgi:DNA repair protein RecO (recombination protein O)
MTLVPTEAIVLQSFAYGETSRIVRLLTRAAGVHSAIAKGALRPRSRFAHMEPFAEGMASLYIRPGRDLQTLGGFDLTRSRQALGRDLLRFGGACLVAELVMRTASEEPQAALFDAVVDGLDRLVTAEPERVEFNVLAVTWHVIAILGFGPELDACTVCGCASEPEAETTFDYAGGGIRCDVCASGLPGRRIPARARRALAAYTRGEPVSVALTDGHWRLLARYLEHHLLEGTPLRSLQFLAANLSAG